MSGYVPKLIKRTENKKSGEIVTALDWNTLFNLLIDQGDDTAVNLETLYNIISETYSNTAKVQEMIDEKVVQVGTADMAKIVYDTNKDGIVDKAEAVINDSITTANIKANAVTEAKLASAVRTKLNKIHSAMFKINYNNATSKTTGETSTYITKNDTYFFNLGFTPKAVLVFAIEEQGEDSGTNYARERSYRYAIFSYEKFYEYSDYDNVNYEDYGGFATTNSPAIGMETGVEMFSITTNGINFKDYHYYKESSDGGDTYKIINLAGSYCIAIG